MQLDWTSILRGHPVFSLIDADEIDRLVKTSAEREFGDKDVIVQEGVPGESLFLIGSGRVDIFLKWTDLQNIRTTTLGAGEIFGEMAVIEPSRMRSATVIASGRCLLLEISGAEFIELMQRYPPMALQVLSIVSSRLRDVNERTFKVVFNELEEKLVALDAKIDSKFEGARVIFDHIDVRAHEIIESAERGRTRATWLFSTISGVITTVVVVLGLFGWREIDLLSTRMNKVGDTLTLAEETASKAELLRVELDRLLREEDVKEFKAQQELLDEMAEKAAHLVFLPRWRSDMEEQKYYTALNLYNAIRRLSPGNPPISQFLIEIEEAFMRRTPETMKSDDGYRQLLESILDDKELSSSDELHLRYLLWAHAILQSETAGTEAFSVFEVAANEYAKNNDAGSLPLRAELLGVAPREIEERARRRLCDTLTAVFPNDRAVQLRYCQ